MTQKQLKDIKIRKTINLPTTSFAMRANLAQNEPQSLKRWKKANLYTTISEHTKSKTPFVFHDGPPYANGDIHLGHLLNKVLKYCVVRSQLVMDKRCDYIPGWDCHGLPIEHKVMTELTKSGKIQKIASLSPDQQKMAIRNECMTYAKKYIKIQSNQMQSLLTLADYDKPYLTMQKHYEKDVLNCFSKMVDEGIVYRKLKPVHWSIANQTALAEAELEYFDKKDTSIHVGFESTDSIKLSELFNYKLSTNSSINFMIWTTTPWTLPANLAIAIEPSFEYSLVEINANLFIVAKELIPTISKLTETSITELSTIKGELLLNQTYQHPFCDYKGICISANFVNLDDGTGIVHLAPGHGTDDYLACLAHNIDIYCPVKADGTYDDTVPDWIKGEHIWKANAKIIDVLDSQNNLFFKQEFLHSYPHDWRSKTPVIFRSTEQWFISVDKALKSTNKSLRDMALAAIENDIEFFPAWGKNRLAGMLEARPDWCISRQRSWGLPIPAFTDGTTVLMTSKSIESITAIISQEGSDAWFKKSAPELLAHYNKDTDPDFPKEFNLENAQKMYDIFDVWFESGSSWNCVLKQRQNSFPADLYLEGSDQHRGWFHLSLLPSLAVQKQPPFKQLLTHGFIVDKHGKKMSKSIGNTLNVQDILKNHGAEITRWWVSSLSYDTDIKVDLSFFNQAGDSYRKIRNTIRFLLSNLYDLDQTESLDELKKIANSFEPNSLESYMIKCTENLQTAVTNAFNQFNFKLANQLIYDFCNDQLSSFYCSISKDILYCDISNSTRRRNIQYCLWTILEALLRLLSPILPHTTEEAYQALYKDPTLLIFLSSPFNVKSNETLSDWNELLQQRQDILKLLEDYKEKGIENSLDAGLIFPDSLSHFSKFNINLPDFFGVSRVTFHNSSTTEIVNLENEPRCERSWKREASVKDRGDGLFLSDRDADAIKSYLEA